MPHLSHPARKALKYLMKQKFPVPDDQFPFGSNRLQWLLEKNYVDRVAMITHQDKDGERGSPLGVRINPNGIDALEASRNADLKSYLALALSAFALFTDLNVPAWICKLIEWISSLFA